eukprot:COSAG06_NODE_11128_length_1562_cov_5.483937_1_plen_304_part_00
MHAPSTTSDPTACSHPYAGARSSTHSDRIAPAPIDAPAHHCPTAPTHENSTSASLISSTTSDASASGATTSGSSAVVGGAWMRWGWVGGGWRLVVAEGVVRPHTRVRARGVGGRERQPPRREARATQNVSAATSGNALSRRGCHATREARPAREESRAHPSREAAGLCGCHRRWARTRTSSASAHHGLGKRDRRRQAPAIGGMSGGGSLKEEDGHRRPRQRKRRSRIRPHSSDRRIRAQFRGGCWRSARFCACRGRSRAFFSSIRHRYRVHRHTEHNFCGCHMTGGTATSLSPTLIYHRPTWL